MTIITTPEEMTKLILANKEHLSEKEIHDWLLEYFGKTVEKQFKVVAPTKKTPLVATITSYPLAQQYALIEKHVTRMFEEQLNINIKQVFNFKTTDSISDKLGADDLDIVELVMGCEEEFDIEINGLDELNSEEITMKHFCDAIFQAISEEKVEK
jgi:acyl carrier protein